MGWELLNQKETSPPVSEAVLNTLVRQLNRKLFIRLPFR